MLAPRQIQDLNFYNYDFTVAVKMSSDSGQIVGSNSQMMSAGNKRLDLLA